MASPDRPKKNEARAERPNKTQIKREMAELHEMAIRLVNLSDGATKKMPIDQELQSAISLARKIRNTREGYRRQLQLITKLLRNTEHAAIRHELDGLQRSGDQENARFHALERWRDRILEGGDDAIQAFINEHPDADRQKIRGLVRKVQKEQAEDKPPAAFRELFKVLREASQ